MLRCWHSSSLLCRILGGISLSVIVLHACYPITEKKQSPFWKDWFSSSPPLNLLYTLTISFADSLGKSFTFDIRLPKCRRSMPTDFPLNDIVPHVYVPIRFLEGNLGCKNLRHQIPNASAICIALSILMNPKSVRVYHGCGFLPCWFALVSSDSCSIQST